MTMHILFESHGLNEFGESETFKAYEVVASATEYAKVSLVLPTRWVDKAPSLERLGVNVYPVDYDSTRYPFSPQVEYAYRQFADQALRAVSDVLPDVDVVHRLNPNAVRFASAIALSGTPFVIGPLGWSCLPGPWAREPAGAVRNSLKLADRFRIRARFTRLHRMYDAAAAIALGNGAALEAFPESLRHKCTTTYEWIDTNVHSQLDWANNSVPTIVFIGRLIPYKGIEFLIAALGRMKDVDWQLHIVGDGPLERALKAQTVDLGLSSRIHFAGRVTREVVRDYYRMADVCCFPGLNESAGNVNVEAMAAGRPLVVANWAGPRELVTDECGVRVPVDSKEAFTSGIEIALRRLVRDEAARVRMGECGRKRAIDVYDVRIAMDKFRRLHEAAADSRSHLKESRVVGH